MTECSTTRYEFAHGRKPRGTGWWMFAACVNGRSDQTKTVEARGTYTQARAEATRKFRAMNRDFSNFSVCP